MGRKILLVLCAAAASVQAEQNFEMPTSKVNEYRVESHYGPEIAVMKPLYPFDSKFEIGAGFGYSSVSSLTNYFAATGSAVYHISRRHAFEPIWFAFAFPRETNFVESKIAAQIPGKASTLSVEYPQMVMAASYLFSPYYAKMQITERTVTHFDTYLGAGFGVMRTKTHFLDNHDGDSLTRGVVSLALGVRFLFEPRWGLRLEMRDLIHKEANFGSEKFANTLQLTASLNVFFGSFPDYTI